MDIHRRTFFANANAQTKFDILCILDTNLNTILEILGILKGLGTRKVHYIWGSEFCGQEMGNNINQNSLREKTPQKPIEMNLSQQLASQLDIVLCNSNEVVFPIVALTIYFI